MTTTYSALLFPLLFCGFFFVVIILIVRAAKQSGEAAAPPRKTLTTLVDDGFWIDSCPAAPAAIIRYQFWANGQARSGEASYHPGPDGRHFVYTGMRPDQVEIIGIMQPPDDSPPIIIPTMVDDRPPFSNHSHSIFSSTSSRHPSAY